MIKLLRETNTGNTIVREYNAESTDTKPTLSEIYTGSSLFCVDNGDVWLWHINSWRQL